MPYFAVICRDKPGSLELRLATRERHLEYHASNLGMVRIGGAIRDVDGVIAGSVGILEAPDLAAARAFIQADPYTEVGLFASVDVYDWSPFVGQAP